jgi:prolyl 4-hydroxylase
MLASSCFAQYKTECLSEMPKIVTVSNFLSPEECDYLIRIASPQLARSTVVNELSNDGDEKIDFRRTSRGMFLMQYQRDKLIQDIDKRLADLTGFPRENGEIIQVLLYEKGAEYQPHYDFFDPHSSGGAAHLQRGGQRLATVIMYLNTPVSGGETTFPLAGVSITPVKGSAVLFYNCLPSGDVDYTALHGGAPVLAGEKWIATKWFRKGVFH